MRLHTDFHDYYDNAVGYGVDDKVHFNRFTREVEIQIKARIDFPNHGGAGILGFCGKIYPFIECRKYNRKNDDEYRFEDYKVVERFYAYSFKEYQQKEAEWEDYTYSYYGVDHSREIKLKQFFIDWHYESDDIFLEYKVPTWLLKLDHTHIGILNPKLKDYGFERMKDSFTAFQEISMYLSNILVEQKKIAVIEDKYRIEQHGFDLKTSFRKEKKKRRLQIYHP